MARMFTYAVALVTALLLQGEAWGACSLALVCSRTVRAPMLGLPRCGVRQGILLSGYTPLCRSPGSLMTCAQRSADLLGNLPPAGDLSVAHYFPGHSDKLLPAGDIVSASSPHACIQPAAH